jgi:hypothetical protein
MNKLLIQAWIKNNIQKIKMMPHVDDFSLRAKIKFNNSIINALKKNG